MAMLWFYCDESYSSSKPNAYVIAGFIASERVWEKIERAWGRKNDRIGVTRFHASHLNALDNEFEGWTPQRSKRYTKSLIKILQKPKRDLHAASVGILRKDYERIISEDGRKKFGNPYIVCFKECVTLIAQEMYKGGWEPDDKFSVIFDRNDFQAEAQEVFFKMKDSTHWPASRHLGTCAPGSAEGYIPLQAADLIAYETFRLLQSKISGNEKLRKALGKLLPKNGFSGYYYEPELLQDIKETIENAQVEPNGFIAIHPLPYTTADLPAGI
jgi:hypothetical protein